MKKLTSILCALAIVLSASAAPVGRLSKITTPTEKKARIEKLADLRHQQSVKKADNLVAVKQLQRFSTKKVAVANGAAKAPKAKQETFNITVGKVSSTFYAEDNDVYYVLYNEDKSKVYAFDIIVADGLQDVESGKTYTIEDMLTDYCGWGESSSEYFTSSFTNASFTKTVAEDESYTITASATDENGDEFIFSYEGEAFVPQEYNLTMASCTETFYTSGNDVYVKLTDPTGNYIFYFDIFVEDGQTALESGKTYSLADMDATYCKGLDYVNGEYVYYSTATFTKTIAEDGSYTIAAFVLDTKGNTWNISYEKEAVVLPAGGDFEIVEISEKFYSSDNDVYVVLYDENNNRFRFDIVVADGLEALELGKTYTLDDMLANYSYATFNDEKITYASATFVKTLNEDGSGDINASFVDGNGNTWNLHYAIPEPAKAEVFETITAEVSYTSEVIWYWTLYTFTAADENNTIEFTLMPDETFYGTWAAGDGSDIEGTVTPAGGEASEIVSGEVVITQTAEGFTITGAVLCDNNTEYTLNLTWVKPDVTRQVELTISGLELGIYTGAWQLDGYNEDSTVYVSIAAYSDEIAGTYTAEDLAADYCNIYTDIVRDEDGSLDSYNKFTLLDANLTVNFNEEDQTITITGTFVGMNGEDVPEFTLNLSGSVPEEDPVEANSEEVTFSMKDMDITLTAEYWKMTGKDSETNYYLAIQSLSPEIAGEYTEADLDDYWTYVGVGNNTYFDINKAAITVSFENNILAVTGTITFVEGTSKDTIFATIDVAGETDGEEHLDYDNKNSDFIVDFPNPTVILDNVSSYGLLYVTATNADNTTITLEFNVSNDTEALAAGEYPINTTGEVGTLSAGNGVDSEGYLVGSFAGTKDSDGYIEDIWFMTSGTATVDENGIITINSVNSYGKLIQSKVGTVITAVDNVEAGAVATKRLENTSLIIEKSGVRYNVLGTVVK